MELGATITRQEAWLGRDGRPIRVPDFMAELVERIAFEARADKRVDKKSGVPQRLPISVLENVVSNAERRAIATKEKAVVPRVSDVYAALPAITGKLELEYEGELQGADAVAKDLVKRAAGATFESRVGGANVDDIVHWFDEGGALRVISRRGEVSGFAHVTEAVRPGAIFVPFVKLADSAANFLTNSAHDPTSKIPEYKVCAVRLEKA